jgi:phage protein D
MRGMWMGRAMGAVAVAMAIGVGAMVGATGAVAGAPAAKKEPARAASDADDAHRRQDIERHRTMAAAHGAAAACLESGNSEKQCQETLREACKGIAVGRYCGMRHAN